MRTNETEFIEKLGKIIEAVPTLLLIKDPSGLVFVEAPVFSYATMQKFMHLLGRTSCEWYIYPSSRIERGVQLKIRLF